MKNKRIINSVKKKRLPVPEDLKGEVFGLYSNYIIIRTDKVHSFDNILDARQFLLDEDFNQNYEGD